MILLAGALLLAALVLTGALVVGWVADRYTEHDPPELDEQEVERLLYPDGNVLVLERTDPDDQIRQDKPPEPYEPHTWTVGDSDFYGRVTREESGPQP